MNNNDNRQNIKDEQNLNDEAYVLVVDQEMEKETLERESMVSNNEEVNTMENTLMKDNENKLMKDKENNMLFGVCSGIAKYLGWSPKRVRTLLILLTLLGGSGILIYGLLAVTMPKKDNRPANKTSNGYTAIPEKALAL